MSEHSDGHIVKRFDRELDDLNTLVLTMGKTLIQQLNHALQARHNSDSMFAVPY